MLIPFTSASFTNLSGLAVADGAEVEVRLESNGALAALFDDRDGTTPLTNPFNADSQGRFAFYVAGVLDGYSVEVTKGAQTHILHHQLTNASAATIYTPFGTGAVSRSQQEKSREIVSLTDYDNGSADKGDIFNKAVAALSPTYGGVILVPAGTYACSTPPVVTAPTHGRIEIIGYGAEFTTSGGISALKITGGDTTGGVVVRGLKINQRGNATATYGFDITQAWRAHLYDCFVEAHGVSATYAAYHVGNSSASDPTTGSFWTQLINCGCRKRSGADSGDITYGILMEGAANATRVLGGAYANVTTGVKIQNYPGEVYVANGAVVHDVAFETYGTAIHVSGAAASNLTGFNFAFNRFESGTTVHSFTGVTSQPANPLILGPGNQFVADAGTYLNNPNGLAIVILDFGLGSNIQAYLAQSQALKVQSFDGGAHALELHPGGGGRGVQLYDNAGNLVSDWSWTSGSDSMFRCNSGAATVRGGTNVSLQTGAGANDNVKISDLNGTSSWGGGHLMIGTHHLWFDASGNLRRKDGTPTSDTDGTIVG